MAARKNQSGFKVRVNLLVPQGNAEKLGGKLLKWLLSYGQYIAILSAVALFILFFIQNQLANQLSSINQGINDQIDHITSASSQLDQIGNLQTKLTTIKDTYSNTPDWQGFFDSLAAQIPSSIKLATLNVDHSLPPGLSFKITGSAGSNNDVAVFVKGLKSESLFKNIVLTNLSLDQNQINFSISGGE